MMSPVTGYKKILAKKINRHPREGGDQIKILSSCGSRLRGNDDHYFWNCVFTTGDVVTL
jgi:hypothetical protein